MKPIDDTNRQTLFKSIERNWQEAHNTLADELRDVEVARLEIARLNEEYADVAGKAAHEHIAAIKAALLLVMPETNKAGTKLSNEQLRNAWVTEQLESNKEVKELERRLAEYDGLAAVQRQVIDFAMARMPQWQAEMAHCDAMLGFFRKG